MHTARLSLLAAGLTLALAGCAGPEAHRHGAGPGAGPAAGMHGHAQGPGMGGDGKGMGMGMGAGRMAMASLGPTQGNTVRGLVVFHQMADGQVMVHARVSGLKPNGEHGFHIHEKGDCASTDGTSAGGHFNPDGKPHGPQTAAHHAGDMPSLKADANGMADQKFTLSGGPSVAAGAASVVGRSVIVHANPDDYATQPTGNAGGRLACGVIAGH
ncbi:superoxide dismutase family protein [Ideonella sp.]|uniref:superoxide dismutase family protein n=1 Tax=Ideonella sp. TaxID=1929293 RepID=UPI0035B156F4